MFCFDFQIISISILNHLTLILSSKDHPLHFIFNLKHSIFLLNKNVMHLNFFLFYLLYFLNHLLILKFADLAHLFFICHLMISLLSIYSKISIFQYLFNTLIIHSLNFDFIFFILSTFLLNLLIVFIIYLILFFIYFIRFVKVYFFYQVFYFYFLILLIHHIFILTFFVKFKLNFYFSQVLCLNKSILHSRQTQLIKVNTMFFFLLYL